MVTTTLATVTSRQNGSDRKTFMDEDRRIKLPLVHDQTFSVMLFAALCAYNHRIRRVPFDPTNVDSTMASSKRLGQNIANELAIE